MEEEDKQRITLVLPHTLVAAIKRLAQHQRRSCVGEVVWALQQNLQQQQE